MHILLTVLGTNPQNARYALGDSPEELARLAPLALFHLLPKPERPDLVVALCTPEAKKESWPLLKASLHGQCEVQCTDVPPGTAQDDIDRYLSQVADAIPLNRKVDLTVDVTHGYRHFSFLTYTAILYLSALRGVRIRGAYYGLLRRGEVSPFLDLRPLLALPRWFHALQVLRETGSASPMAAAVKAESSSQSAQDLARELSQLSEAHLSGLPLELGELARRFRKQRSKPLRKVLRDDHHLPLAAELVERFTEILRPFASAEAVPGDGWKNKIALSEPELGRQARVVDDLLQRESFAAALGLMNEWTVSWAVWRLDLERGWLEFSKVRRRAANLLGAIMAAGKDPELRSVLTGEQRALGLFWGSLTALRNAYHHHGMRPQLLVGSGDATKKLKEIRSYWQESLRSCPTLSLALGSSRSGQVLVSPIGRKPGVLFSALQACRAESQREPSECLVVCSQESEELITKALHRAKYLGPVEPLRLDDPYSGRSEIDRLVKSARRRLLEADEIFVNLTGGTTLMGLAVQAIANAARRLARPVRRFGLIDRRPSDEQDAEPYEIGEPFWLDPSEDGES